MTLTERKLGREHMTVLQMSLKYAIVLLMKCVMANMMAVLTEYAMARYVGGLDSAFALAPVMTFEKRSAMGADSEVLEM